MVAVHRVLRLVRERAAGQARASRHGARHLSPQPLPAYQAGSVGRVPETARWGGYFPGQQVRHRRFASASVPQRPDHVHSSLNWEVTMRSLRRLTLAIVLVLIPLWGCDGRGGSSGLDVTSENAVISQALSKRQCLGFQALTICPADEPATGTPSIDTTLANVTAIDCFQSTPGGSCTFILRFT